MTLAASFRLLWKEYLSSFRELKTRQAGYVMLVDAAFYITILLLSFMASALGVSLKQSVSAALVATLEEGVVAAVLWKMVILIILLVLGWLAAWSLSRAVIWSVIFSKPITKQYLLQCSVLSALWLIAWFTPIVLLFRVTNQGIQQNLPVSSGLSWAVYALLTLWFYFTYPLYVEFCSSGAFFRSIGNALVKGVKHVPQLIVPFIAMVATVMIMSRVSLLANYLPSLLTIVVSSVLLFGTFTWAKLYYRSVLGRVLHHQPAHHQHHRP